MTHLYLIRHGDAIEDLKDGIYQDLGLSADGVRQVARLRDRLARTGEIKGEGQRRAAHVTPEQAPQRGGGSFM